jgi:hypothetical protein
MQAQRKELRFKGENIYAGIDVHAKSWKITIATDYLLHKSFVMPPVPDKLLEYLKVNYPDGNYLRFSAKPVGLGVDVPFLEYTFVYR